MGQKRGKRSCHQNFILNKVFKYEYDEYSPTRHLLRLNGETSVTPSASSESHRRPRPRQCGRQELVEQSGTMVMCVSSFRSKLHSPFQVALFVARNNKSITTCLKVPEGSKRHPKLSVADLIRARSITIASKGRGRTALKNIFCLLVRITVTAHCHTVDPFPVVNNNSVDHGH